MRDYIKQPGSEVQRMEDEPKAANQASIEDMIADVQRRTNIYSGNTIQQKSIEEEELLQPKAKNKTGLPDTLKTGVENLSGYSMDDVRVHYNSDKPAQLNALAYAQGTDIHVAPGQEEHLPHEAWHVVQQKQGRVQPTMQMQGVSVNDNEGLEREADVMGSKAFPQNKFVLQQTQNSIKSLKKINSNNSILQGTWDETLPKNDKDMVEALKKEYPDATILEWKVKQTREDKETLYTSLEQIAIKLGLIGTVGANEGTGSSSPNKNTIPFSSSQPKKRPSKKHQPVWDGGTELKINNVWVGNKSLGTLEKFNIYSWRALGHKVTIYCLRLDEKPVSHALLGLDPEDAEVVDMRMHLEEDDKASEDKPKKELSDVRDILKSWIRQLPALTIHDIDTDTIPMNATFNIVDTIKSYIGGTQQGIVLDMKVGPSVHIQDYAATMQQNFISYTRGNSAVSVENQCMGTMAKDDNLRLKYAEFFNSKMKSGADKNNVNQTNLYNTITGYHGQAWKSAKGFDVAKYKPDKEKTENQKEDESKQVKLPREEIKNNEYNVSELDGPGKGPFRVYKGKDDQTHKGKPQKSLDKVFYLAQEVVMDEFSKIKDQQGYISKMKKLIEKRKSATK